MPTRATGRQPQRPSSTGHMRYVVCPQCGDPVAGRLPPDSSGQVNCVHCKHVFPFDESLVRPGLVTYDEATGRWRAVFG
jgi:hypothetical protein